MTRIRTKLAIAVSTLSLGIGGTVMSLAIFGTAHATAFPTWQITAPAAINLTCGGSPYNHTLNTVTENRSTGDFSGTGTYNADGSYTWDITGNTTGNNLTFKIVYTGSNPGYTLNGNGTINPNGSVSGTVDNNCQTFSMPAGTAHLYCAPTGFFRDGNNMTAALINPASTVSGTLDATGCNVGIYYGPGQNGTVNGAEVFGANYYGVVVQQANVNIKHSKIHNIGEAPFNGTQHGVGIYYATIAGVANGDCIAGTTSGTVSDNVVSAYQKGGIVGSCPGTTLTVKDNTVKGLGPVNFIAQNGIQISYGANGSVTDNRVSGNAYTGGNFASSGGILIFGGLGSAVTTNVAVKDNVLLNNDVGVFTVNYNSDGSGASTTPTKDIVRDNFVYNKFLTNTTGLCDGDASCGGAAIGYQAGINDVGNTDTVCDNTIGGAGYAWQGMYNYSVTPAVFTQTGSISMFARQIDAGDSFPTINAKVCDNHLLYNKHPEVSGDVKYSAYGLARHAEFRMESADNTGSFRYSDANGDWYDVSVKDVKTLGHNGYFAGVVTKASNPGWVGQWLFAEVNDGHPDQIWGSFTNQTTAQQGVQNMTNPADGPFNVTHGNLSIH